MYTFQIQWPVPFRPDWCTSGQRFSKIEDAGKALGEFLAVSFENDVAMIGRIVQLESQPSLVPQPKPLGSRLGAFSLSTRVAQNYSKQGAGKQQLGYRARMPLGTHQSVSECDDSKFCTSVYPRLSLACRTAISVRLVRRFMSKSQIVDICLL